MRVHDDVRHDPDHRPTSTFRILFQYFVIAPLRHQVGRLAPLGDAIKSDTLSVLSFEVGLFGWMAVAHYVIWK